MPEQTVWVNKLRQSTRIGPRKELENIGSEYKQSINTWIINSKRELLLQKRSANKKHNPNKWANTGGGIKHDETSVEAVVRECKEELGIDVDVTNLEYKMTLQREYDYVDVYVLYQDIDINSIKYQESEVSDVKYFTIQQIEQMINNNELSPSSRVYFGMLQITIDKDFNESYVRRIVKKEN
ncbi:MAG: NUDIX domain-containing protein [Bacilli bacterium]|nr:NUDIX domain-containing protein [Bacilli bacterium]